VIEKKIKVGDLLIEKGRLTYKQLQEALQIQKRSNFTKKLGEILIDEGYVNEREIAKILASQLDIEFIDIYGVEIDFDFLSAYPINLLKNSYIIPFKNTPNFVHVAVADPLNYDAIELIERTTAVKPLKIYIALKSDIRYVFERYEIIETTRAITENVKKEIVSGGFRVKSEQSSIMQLIEQILKNAIFNNASDIHIEPNSYNASVRMRIDGVLKESFVFDLDVYNALASRIKILGNLDISEKRRSQDGRFSMNLTEGKYDFRLSTAPTLHGESIVMRILDQQKILLKLNELGLEEKNLKIFEDLLRMPYGIVFVTGPTGSGKTTTLYAALNEIKSIENKVITIEDPVEYQLPLIQQIQINEKIDYSFAKVLRSLLRQDPDIIMLGEVRDDQTLQAAVQASLTGHLVFSTLHTNDAPSAITRMVQMGMEPYLVADSLIGIIAQRLVRKICPHCKIEHKPHYSLLDKIKDRLPENPKFYIGKGCQKCGMSGYIGRAMICEILKVTDRISHLISINMNKYEIEKQAAKNEGYEPMINDGLRKALKGITTLEEVLRVAKI
jgi:general secretion pathway protein E/type IV pilus assembly protein PilB